TADARGGGVSGCGIGQVACAGTADGVEPELDGFGDRDADDALFVAVGRVVARVVLDVELRAAELSRKTLGFAKRRQAGVQAGDRLTLAGKQVPIAPQALRPGFDGSARHLALHGCVVVLDLVGAETLLADMDRRNRHAVAAFLTLESED